MNHIPIRSLLKMLPEPHQIDRSDLSPGLRYWALRLAAYISVPDLVPLALARCDQIERGEALSPVDDPQWAIDAINGTIAHWEFSGLLIDRLESMIDDTLDERRLHPR